MKLRNLLFIIFTFSLFFTGCSYKNTTEVSNIKNSPNDSSQTLSDYNNLLKTNFYDELAQQDYSEKEDELDEINEGLFSIYNQWKGTKYKLGGTTKKGIDCSAFVQKVFQEGFGLDMPRDTISLSKVGVSINKNELKTGDLVFFKTRRNNHVGIYLEDGKFMHSSTKRGVSISTLNSDYFKNKYWKAQRIFN